MKNEDFMKYVWPSFGAYYVRLVSEMLHLIFVKFCVSEFCPILGFPLLPLLVTHHYVLVVTPVAASAAVY